MLFYHFLCAHDNLKSRGSTNCLKFGIHVLYIFGHNLESF
jgi:hypothetical protein